MIRSNPDASLRRIARVVGLCVAVSIAGCSARPEPQVGGAAGAGAQTVTPSTAVAAPTAATPSTTGTVPPVATATASGPKPAASAPSSTVSAAAPKAAPGAAAATSNRSAAIPSAPAAPAASAASGKGAVAPASAKEGAAPEATQKSAPTLDLGSLTQRLKDTKAIGIMSKIAIKNQVDDLLDQFRAFYQGKLKTTLAELRRPYDLLVLKVLALVQDSDPSLASAIVASREAIWGILADPKKFATVA